MKNILMWYRKIFNKKNISNNKTHQVGDSVAYITFGIDKHKYDTIFRHKKGFVTHITIGNAPYSYLTTFSDKKRKNYNSMYYFQKSHLKPYRIVLTEKTNKAFLYE